MASSREQEHSAGREALAKKTFAVVPAFNAGAEIIDVVRGASRHLSPERVLVVNDGSEDATLETLKRAFSLRQVPIDLERRLPSETVLGVKGDRPATDGGVRLSSRL